MNGKRYIYCMMLGMLFIPSILFARERNDSLVLNRIFDYKRNYTHSIDGLTKNVYVKSTFNTEQRNPLLFLVPTMYTIAKGARDYVVEGYYQMNFEENGRYQYHRQVATGTIPHHRNTMPAMLELLTPRLYDISIYKQHLLSPFHRSNRRFYRYEIVYLGNGYAKLVFKPRLNNTQLVSGWAYFDTKTGRITSTEVTGEYDMIAFEVEATMGNDPDAIIPTQCESRASFHFLGNRISTAYTAYYDCQKTLPDSVNNVKDRSLMEDLRPIPLEESEQAVYDAYDHQHQKDTTAVDTLSKKQRNKVTDVAWDIISDNLISSLGAESENAYVRMSPLINPLYLSYSHRRGFSYKIKLGARYTFSPHRYLTFDPRIGYNFKIRQFYFTAPLRMTYNPKRNGYAEITWANGNRITNSSVLDVIRDEHRDTIDFSAMELDYFNDNYLRAINNVVAYDWLEIMAGVVYHQRTAVNKQLMIQEGKPVEYRSFSPTITLKLRPWMRGPLFTVNYERSVKDILRSNIAYERWEFDAAYKKRLKSLRVLNFRMGGGFYTAKNTSYFVDFANFRDENLPEGWDDDWTGQFQLLDNRWYNASRYYIRGHVSYESPLLCLSWLPYLGRFIETERIYVSTLNIEHTRPYHEIGYGFTNRFFSMGAFVSLLNHRFQEVGCKFEFELFRKW